jgi:hypothetical protein
MSLKLHLPETDIPPHAEGVIDGIVPVRFEDHGDRWSLRIGADFAYEAPHDRPVPRRTLGSIRTAIYHAVAIYRNACRPSGGTTA